MDAFADITQDLYAGDFHPSLSPEYPQKVKQEKLLATPPYLCHPVYSYRARYCLIVLPFSSEVGIQATQTLTGGDDNQKVDHYC